MAVPPRGRFNVPEKTWQYSENSGDTRVYMLVRCTSYTSSQIYIYILNSREFFSHLVPWFIFPPSFEGNLAGSLKKLESVKYYLLTHFLILVQISFVTLDRSFRKQHFGNQNNKNQQTTFQWVSVIPRISHDVQKLILKVAKSHTVIWIASVLQNTRKSIDWSHKMICKTTKIQNTYRDFF